MSSLRFLTLRSFLGCALACAAIAVALLLASCSSPPPAPKSVPTPPRATAPDREKPSPRVSAPPKPHKATVTTTEVTPTAPGTGSAVVRHRKRLAGYPGEIIHTPSPTKIALTFDAGASPVPTPSILAALKSAGLHVTFFVTGKWCEQNPDLVKQIAAEGHEIGNHTYSHPDLRKLSDDAIAEQLRRTDDIVMRLTGKSTKPLFRPPFGGRDKRVLSVAGREGYTSVYWSLDSLDAYRKGITSGQIETRVLDRIQGGDIVLMHCGSAPTAAALVDIIGKLQQRGYQIVKVSELTAGG